MLNYLYQKKPPLFLFVFGANENSSWFTDFPVDIILGDLFYSGACPILNGSLKPLSTQKWRGYACFGQNFKLEKDIILLKEGSLK